MTHVTCRLTAKNRYQLRNRILGNGVWATYYFYLLTSALCDEAVSRFRVLLREQRCLEAAGWRGRASDLRSGGHKFDFWWD